ncbi:MAG: alpha/beta fold hydrolase [Pirellulales bacterium]|nr:alpha/beta fold hydrolase [Pirellulales bacterium]
MQRATVNDVELAYVDQGTGPVVLLVHGFPLDHTMWRSQIDALAERCRVLAPDLRGFGRSGPVDEQTTVIGMDPFADDLAGLLDEAGVREPIVLCGLSMGGYIALAFLRRHAARLGGLILCDTRATADTADGIAARRQTAQRVLDEGPGFLAETMPSKLFAPATLQERPELVDAIRDVILHTDRRTIAAASLGMGQRMDSTDLLPTAPCPALVLVGQEDVLSPPAEMRALADALPQAQFVEIPGGGHLAPLENPEAVNRAILSFVSSLALPAPADGPGR